MHTFIGDMDIMKTDIEYKFSEDKSIELLKRHIDRTYTSHYSKNKFQSTEFITDSGHGTGFCIGNIMKYAQRYGKKGHRHDHKKDLLKILHYAIIQLHIHEKDFIDEHGISDTVADRLLDDLVDTTPKGLLSSYGDGC